MTVSGDKGIYASPFDLEPGTWTTAVKINNDDPGAQEILVVSFFIILSGFVTCSLDTMYENKDKIILI